jgi:lysozyme
MSVQNSRARQSSLSKVQRKPSVRKKTNLRKGNNRVKFYQFLLVILTLFLLTGVIYHYRFEWAQYFSFVYKPIENKNKKWVEEARIYNVLSAHSKKVYGIDVSEYQGNIDWNLIKTVEDSFPISFVFMRATAGKNKVDQKFSNNWKKSKGKVIRGAYHYYRPNENSIEQANLFIKTVKLESGDLPPVLDIEKLPKTQSIERLKVGLRRWLHQVEEHYKVRPIIYSGERYYHDFLKNDFSEYTFWIANYNFWVENVHKDWLFWQFSEKASVSGIQGGVDVNIYNGTPKMLQYLTLRK